jgi:hypothetical protein
MQRKGNKTMSYFKHQKLIRLKLTNRMFKKYHIDEICPDNFLFDKEIEYEGTDKERYFNENPSKTRTRKNFFTMPPTD